MEKMTAQEARIRATIERVEDVERKMEEILNKIESACDKGQVSLVVNKSELSLKVIQELTELGYTVISNKDLCKEQNAIIKW